MRSQPVVQKIELVNEFWLHGRTQFSELQPPVAVNIAVARNGNFSRERLAKGSRSRERLAKGSRSRERLAKGSRLVLELPPGRSPASGRRGNGVPIMNPRKKITLLCGGIWGVWWRG